MERLDIEDDRNNIHVKPKACTQIWRLNRSAYVMIL